MIDADFLHAKFTEPVARPDLELSSPSRFFNRELSWLSFNWRVLEEASNPDVPLLERVRFVSISATNLDEFITVRVAGLREMKRKAVKRISSDGRTAEQQLDLIDADARALMLHQQEVWTSLRKELEGNDISLLRRKDLSAADLKHLDQYFLNSVFPVLSPLAVDPAHPFPFIPNEGLSLALELRRDKDGRKLLSLLPIPHQIDRFILLPGGKKSLRYLPLEELLLEKISVLFPGYSIKGHCTFRVLRDSDLEVEDEAEDLVRGFETALKRRRRGEVIRLSLSAGAPMNLKRMVTDELHVPDDEVIEMGGMVGIADLGELVSKRRRDLLWPEFTPRVPERVQDHEGDIFAAIRQKDMLLHHPYESFDLVIRFLKQAAADPDVVAIKQTIRECSKKRPTMDFTRMFSDKPLMPGRTQQIPRTTRLIFTPSELAR